MKKLLFIAMLLFCSTVIGKTDGVKKDWAPVIRELETREMKMTPFSMDNLVKYLSMIDAPDPKVMISQFIVETGWFKSKLFTIGNNICGMKMARKRQTLATGTLYGYAAFAHWSESVDDFLLWLKYHNLFSGYFEYIQKKSYSENENYYHLVLKVYKQIQNKFNMNKPSAIITGDWHLREDQPICRTDDFQKSQWKKVDFIAELGAKYRCPVVHTGDLFNHWKPSPYLITQTMRHLPANFWTVYGNHDLPQHSLELADKCGMNVLAEAKKLVILPYGTHWGMKPTGASFPSYQGQFDENVSRKVLVWHVMTWLKELPWPGCTDAPALQLLKDHPEYDLIATGHNHKSFVASLRGRLLINPGGITRQTADQIDHKPSVYLWYAKENTCERIELPIEQGVITREHIDSREQRDERIAAFVDRLDDDWEVSMSFEENLERFRANNNIRESVMKIIYEALEL